jgi:hypothetical protein
MRMRLARPRWRLLLEWRGVPLDVRDPRPSTQRLKTPVYRPKDDACLDLARELVSRNDQRHAAGLIADLRHERLDCTILIPPTISRIDRTQRVGAWSIARATTR